MPTLTTKSDYFAISRSQGLPARCPILDRCERRSNTLAIANGWSFEDSIALAKLRQPVVHVVGESPYSIGGTNNFIAGGPERVNEFATPGCLHSVIKRQVLCGLGIPSFWVG